MLQPAGGGSVAIGGVDVRMRRGGVHMAVAAGRCEGIDNFATHRRNIGVEFFWTVQGNGRNPIADFVENVFVHSL